MDSPRAGGRYFITGTEAALRRYTTERERARLTSWLVEQRRLGAECPEVTTKAVEDTKRRPPLSVHERADQLLKCISLELDDVADMFVHGKRHGKDNPLHCRMAWSESIRFEEVTYLVDYLEGRAWIERDGSKQHPMSSVSIESPSQDTPGSPKSRRPPPIHPKAFVAMWFDDSMDEVWEHAIKPGIEEGRLRTRPHRSPGAPRTRSTTRLSPRCGALGLSSRTSLAGRGRCRGEACTTRRDSRSVVIFRSFSRVGGMSIRGGALRHASISTISCGKCGEARCSSAGRLTTRIGATIGDGPRKPQ